ncbi:MAG: hypothetical protein WC358_00115 [Ignavibacteria bacterium]|jgi:hypothetical protein
MEENKPKQENPLDKMMNLNLKFHLIGLMNTATLLSIRIEHIKIYGQSKRTIHLSEKELFMFNTEVAYYEEYLKYIIEVFDSSEEEKIEIAKIVHYCEVKMGIRTYINIVAEGNKRKGKITQLRNIIVPRKN